MVFHKIVVVESEKNTIEHIQNRECLKKILRDLNKNIEWIIFPEITPASLENKDLIITLGGDGVFVRASHYLRETPILGINSDPMTSEGALDDFKGVNEERIKKILLGDFRIKKRTRGRVIRNGQLLKELVINEAYIGVENQFHTSGYVLSFQEIEEEQRSSGVIVSTGSGSKAWYKSAGGQAFSEEEPYLKFKVRELYDGNLFNSKIKEGTIDKDNKIVLKSKRKEGGIVAIDSVVTYPFNLGDVVEVRVCKQDLNVVVSNN